MDQDDEAVGYKRPPREHRFRKGKSGNPAGRPKKVKPPVRTSERDILKAIDAETLIVGGVEMSRREAELRLLQAKALKGDLRAMKMIDDKRSALKLDEPQQKSGVLVVPMAIPREDWEIQAYYNQMKYRTSSYSALDELERVQKELAEEKHKKSEEDEGS